MPMVFIRHVGANLAFVHPIEGPVDPGWGGGGPDHIWGGVGGRPDRPDHSLPGGWGGHIDNSLPGAPGHPDNRPPSGPPPQVGPGEVLVLVRDQAGVWHYASLPSGSPPPPVPVPPPDHISNRPPGSGLPPHVSGQPVPPTAGTPLPPTPAPKT